MTIKRGDDWGTVGHLAPEAPIADSDRSLADSLSTTEHQTVGLTGGDLARTIGAAATAAQLRSSERTLLPIDIGEVQLDGAKQLFAAHVIIRKPLWAGVTTAIMNSAFLGEWNVAPRGHPNDGRLDLITARLSFGDRLKARRRLKSGTHVPHPGIRIERVESGELVPPPHAVVHVDGVRWGVASNITFRVWPDAATVVI